ncbi:MULTISPECIES: hypothetical protein [unclassified Pseudomonas]|uniref:hypothetical protein n=1 Tax=unclassified Pseudomonas TaxID=196821 RepID=UPI00161E4E4A|nr:MULTISPECIES: hypothetical protein [unclassified Pseudomonas]MBB6288701.1 hypothetical protein [Pseudomonas sp. SJZ073]MBB6313673.1 hypothetical protein [Pseudomonas sp. JAI120]
MKMKIAFQRLALLAVVAIISLSAFTHVAIASATENDDRSEAGQNDDRSVGENNDQSEAGQNDDRSEGEYEDRPAYSDDDPSGGDDEG